MENIMTMSQCIKNIRLRLCKNQSEFAEMIEKDKTSVCLYESGKRKPGFPTIRMIVDKAKERGVNIEYSDFFDKLPNKK